MMKTTVQQDLEKSRNLEVSNRLSDHNNGLTEAENKNEANYGMDSFKQRGSGLSKHANKRPLTDFHFFRKSQSSFSITQFNNKR